MVARYKCNCWHMVAERLACAAELVQSGSSAAPTAVCGSAADAQRLFLALPHLQPLIEVCVRAPLVLVFVHKSAGGRARVGRQNAADGWRAEK